MRKNKHLTPLKAIRKFCVKCTGSQKAPKSCPLTECPLWRFREGHNPKRRGRGDPKHFAHTTPRNLSNKGILETIIDGKKRIRLIVEDLPEKNGGKK